jgi:hypothetical protein
MLQPYFEWMGRLPVSQAMNESGWMVALIQSIHLLALVLLAGSLLIVDLRLLGHGLTDRPAVRLARSARPWLLTGLVGLVVTGIPQLMSLAEKEYYNDYFWMKMYFLAAALVFTMTVRRSTINAGERVHPWLAGTVGVVSIGLWFSVAISARLIGLF